jgi:hypothetical protein
MNPSIVTGWFLEVNRRHGQPAILGRDLSSHALCNTQLAASARWAALSETMPYSHPHETRILQVGGLVLTMSWLSWWLTVV